MVKPDNCVGVRACGFHPMNVCVCERVHCDHIAGLYSCLSILINAVWTNAKPHTQHVRIVLRVDSNLLTVIDRWWQQQLLRDSENKTTNKQKNDWCGTRSLRFSLATVVFRWKYTRTVFVCVIQGFSCGILQSAHRAPIIRGIRWVCAFFAILVNSSCLHSNCKWSLSLEQQTT